MMSAQGMLAAPQRVHEFVQNFDWEEKGLPLSKSGAMITLVLAYLTMIGMGRQIFSRPMQLPSAVPAAHNLVLCIGSLIMFVGTAWEIYQRLQAGRGHAELFCLPPGSKAKGPLFFWSYCYYLSKYYELLDTAILVVKAKPLSRLHVFHHSLVVVMAFLWLETAQSLQHIALLTNTAIHVIMYYYYYRSSIRRPPTWKRLVTSCQIIQFVFSFAISLPFWWMHFKQGGCAGFNAMLFNAAFNLVLLYMFMDFHRHTFPAKQALAIKKQE